MVYITNNLYCVINVRRIITDEPTVVCGNQIIEILIDKRIVTEQNLTDDVSKIYFEGSPGCRAVDRGRQYHLKVEAPFTTCGLILKVITGTLMC